MDVQQVTGSWYGSEHNSYALALACIRAGEPRGSIWTWTDCGGGHPFELAPGAAPMERLGEDSPYLVGPPAGGYPNDYSHYIYDWSMQGQPPARSVSYPVISSESIATLRGHLVIAHGCQAANGTDTVCYAELNSNGKTMRVGF